jgi:hypothetical protein
MPGIIDISFLDDLAEDFSPNESPIAPVIILEPDNNPPGFIIPVITPLSSNEVYIRPTGALTVSSQYEFAEVQVTRTLNEHPSATGTFYTTEIPSIIIGSHVQILGINFVIDSYSLNVYKGTTINAIAVNLSLVGQHAPRGAESPLHPLDRPVTFPVGRTRITWADINARVSTPVNISTGYEKYYSGEEEVIVTPRSELEAASLLSVNPFIKYSTPTITTVPMSGIGLIEIMDAHILDEVAQIEIKDKPKYIDVELILDGDASNVETATEVSTRFEFENCTSYSDLTNPAGAGFILEELILEDLKDPGNNFDNGGRTKTAREIKEKNGNPLWIIEEVYGYVFVSSQLFRLPSGFDDYDFMRANGNKWPLRFDAFPNIENIWQLVERTTTTYNYDGDGYLINSRKNGWRLGRLKRESGEYEAANIWIDTFLNHSVTSGQGAQEGPPPKWKALAREYNAYMFTNPIQFAGENPTFPNVNDFNSPPLFRYSIYERTSYFLAPLTDYYHDMDTPNGQPQSKFAYKTVSFSEDQEIRPNPKDDPNDPGSPYPPLIAHKEKKESSTVQVIVPPSNNSPVKSPEMYAVVDYIHSVEGDHSSSSMKIGNSTQYLGRPSAHTQLPVSIRAEIPDHYARYAENRYLINSIESVPPGAIQTPPPARLGGGTIPTPTSTVSFTGALTPDIGKRGAINSILRKSLGTVTTKVRVAFFEYYSAIEEGSKVVVAGTEYLVTGVSYSIKVYNPGEYYCPDGLNLSLSVVPPQVVSMRSYDREP